MAMVGEGAVGTARADHDPSGVCEALNKGTERSSTSCDAQQLYFICFFWLFWLFWFFFGCFVFFFFLVFLVFFFFLLCWLCAAKSVVYQVHTRSYFPSSAEPLKVSQLQFLISYAAVW